MFKIGDINITKSGSKYKIVEYNNYSNVLIEFEDDYKFRKTTSVQKIKNGSIRNPYEKTILDVGIVGNTKTWYNGRFKKSYTCWYNMITRGYSKEYKKKQPTYFDCTVCDEWLVYENFEKWFDKNYWDCGDEKMQLDKDILFYGNKIYSPKNCIFVPKSINSLFSAMTKKECIIKEGEKFRVQIHTGNHRYLGMFNELDEAFDVYKKEKELYIRQVADEYKNKYPNFPKMLYEAMCIWSV